MTLRLGADAEGIGRAASILAGGGLVAFGTETVYGLGADATNPDAVAAIFEAKGRPHFNPLICHLPDGERAFAEVIASDQARALADAFWPGPLTLVLPRRMGSAVALLASAGLPSLAMRVPASAQARALLLAFGGPVAAPSANRSGRISPTVASDVISELGGRIAAVLDTGPCMVGLESSVVDLTGPVPVLLRPGGVPPDAIERVIGRLGVAGIAGGSAGLRSPGQLASHYAPALPVRLDATSAGPDEALLAFGEAPDGAAITFNLSPRGDLREAASRLFTGLRLLDAEGARLRLARIAAAAVPATGLGHAIRDRLERAAASR